MRRRDSQFSDSTLPDSEHTDRAHSSSLQSSGIQSDDEDTGKFDNDTIIIAPAKC